MVMSDANEESVRQETKQRQRSYSRLVSDRHARLSGFLKNFTSSPTSQFNNARVLNVNE